MKLACDVGNCFKDGFACSQIVLSAFSTEFGLDRETALKVSAAFGGGMGGLGENCGAVSGALMAIGLKYGNSKAKDYQAKEKTYRLSKEFVKQFKALNGSITCNELLNCDISTPEGYQYAKENLFIKICPKLVNDAVQIVGQIL
ncbi:C_GCAxxG_C_C family protein [Desulfofarcimen acetoxidans DSM 771]|jgi:C_GCAxxG_C_C family probable redox protein|uniref:C_GCAxxG_C_C family protein n=1 Tax=Desulfofarcimen acetoxidans (strain ATCC 49208 / DSM 771 / KCTC 5769 / VKM B-1644 / 5575) TaxID=485916 RepID=C8VZZ5_DESAS|nr:C-GCAxxG-C-C family protein [Desulfofarcimen acetoxidans]ACV64963.1 C_GCAxxG_C_C family protein [Desulfofarcimen acetoxidans DSM 771]